MLAWLRRFQYKTVHIQKLSIKWVDADYTSVASVIFQENGFGRRRLKKEGSLSPCAHEEHSLWHSMAVPWREGAPLATSDPPQKNVVKLEVVK